MPQAKTSTKSTARGPTGTGTQATVLTCLYDYDFSNLTSPTCEPQSWDKVRGDMENKAQSIFSKTKRRTQNGETFVVAITMACSEVDSVIEDNTDFTATVLIKSKAEND